MCLQWPFNKVRFEEPSLCQGGALLSPSTLTYGGLSMRDTLAVICYRWKCVLTTELGVQSNIVVTGQKQN